MPNIRSDRPAETREFFVDLLGFEVAMDIGLGGDRRVAGQPRDPGERHQQRGPGRPRISVEVPDVDAVHARAVEQGLEIAYSLRDEDWGVRRFMLREPSGTLVNVVSHRQSST